MFASDYAYQLIVDGKTYILSKSDAEEIASSIEPYYPNDILQLFDDGVDDLFDLTSIDNLNDLIEYGGIQSGIDTFDGAERISIKPAPNKLFEVFLNVRNPQTIDFGGKVWEQSDDARLTPQPPHDGMIAKNIVEGGYAAEIDGQEPPAATDYVVQSPSQIKSATDNNGSFNEESDDTRFSIGDTSYTPATDYTLTDEARHEMQTIRDEAIANGTYMKAPNGRPTNLNERQWLQVRTKAFLEYFGDWLLTAKAKAIQALQATKSTPHSMSRKELESVYKSLPSVIKGDTTISFYGSAFDKNYRENGLFAKAVPVLDKVLDNAVFAYRETDNRAGELRKDGTVHKPHRNIDSYDNYVGKVELEGKEYYVRFTVTNEKNESGVHSQFVSNVELYNNSTKNASGRDSSLPSRLVLDGITDAKLQQFFESAKSAEQNSSKIVDENGEPLVVYHGTPSEFTVFNGAYSSGMFMFTDVAPLAETFARKYLIV